MKLDKDINLISDDAHIDLTPLIDVIFMLLIFFILTMSFSQTALKITLPQSQYSEKIRENNLLSITVSDEGKYLIKNDEVTLEKISLMLEENKDTQLNIVADANCPFQSFLNLVDLAKSKRQGKFFLQLITRATDRLKVNLIRLKQLHLIKVKVKVRYSCKNESI